jgi:voltage-gated potassium channel
MVTQLLHPRVNDFLDRVMHSREMEFWLEETEVNPASTLAGRTLQEADLAGRTGVNLLALVRHGTGEMITNPRPDSRLETGDVLIGFGTRPQLQALADLASLRG